MLRKLHSRIAYANVISTLCLFVLLGGGAWAALAVPAAASAADGIYWANNSSGKIRVGNLNGAGTPADLFPSTTESAPEGVAMAPAAGKIYWATYYSGKIRVGNLNGGGTPADLFPSTTESNPFFLALLRAPVGLAPPTVSGGASAGSRLSCSRGGWAGDLVGAFLYRAPRSFAYQWTRDGAAIPHARASSYTPTPGGRYRCRG